MRTKTKVTHTPGPWDLGGSLITCNGKHVARILHNRKPNKYADTSEQAPMLEEADANARLIASSPELLEACKQAKAVIMSDSKQERESALIELNDALAKAERS